MCTFLRKTSSKTKTKEVEIRISIEYILSLIISVFLLLTKVLNLTQPPTEIYKNIYVPLEGYLIQAPHRKSRKMVQGSVYTHSILCVPPSERCAHTLFHCSRVLCHLSTLVLSCRVCHTCWHIFCGSRVCWQREGRAGTCPHPALIANWEVCAIWELPDNSGWVYHKSTYAS